MRPFKPPATDAARRHRPIAQGCRQRAVQSSPCSRRPRPRPPPAACAVRCRSLRPRPTGCRRRGLPASGASKWRWRVHRQTPAPSGRPCRPTRARPVAHDGCHRCPRPRRPDLGKGMPGARFHGQGVACGVDEVSRGGERGRSGGAHRACPPERSHQAAAATPSSPRLQPRPPAKGHRRKHPLTTTRRGPAGWDPAYPEARCVAGRRDRQVYCTSIETASTHRRPSATAQVRVADVSCAAVADGGGQPLNSRYPALTGHCCGRPW